MKIATPARLVRLLRDCLAASGEVGRTITLEALLTEILPYPVARETLGLAGKAEYDLALLRLLRNRTYLQVDPAVVDAVDEELELPEPGLGCLDRWSDSVLRLRSIELAPLEDEVGDGPAPEAEGEGVDDRPDGGPESTAPPAAGPEAAAPSTSSAPSRAPAPPSARRPDAPPPDASPPTSAPEPTAPSRARPPAGPASDPPAADPLPAAPARCWSCGTGLPARETVLYCPQCGTGQRDRRCAGCGDRVEPEWRFCVRCGRGLPQP